MQLFAFLALLASAEAILLSQDASFEAFVKQYNVKVHASEWREREGLFLKEQARVRAHNARGGSYKMGINQWSASTPKEKRAVLGKRMDMDQAHSPRHVVEEHGFDMLPVGELPDNVDWRTKGMGTVPKDQGHCGSCYAFAAAEMLEDYLYKSSGLLYTLSPQMAASCTPNPGSCGGSGGCMGGTAEIVFDHMAAGEETMAQEWQYGYRSYYGEDYECDVAEVAPLLTVQGFTMLAGNNYTELMNAVAQVGPVSIGVDASEWHNYEGGIFNGCDQKNPDVNHAVVLYGYGIDAETGEKYWNIRNSWSPSYGEKGYIRIHRDDGEGENCGIQLNPQDNDACEGDYKPRKVCGTCGILSGSSYLVGVELYSAE